MRKQKVRLGELLIQSKIISDEQLQQALAEQKRSGRKIGRVLVDLGALTEDQLHHALAGQLELPFVDIRHAKIDPKLVRALPESHARRYRAIVLQADAQGLLVGMADPTDIFSFDELSRHLQQPVRLALGGRDLENGTIEVARRDTREKESVAREGIARYVKGLLAEIQQNLFDRALAFRKEHTSRVDSYDEFKEVLEAKGGFLLAHWDGSAETEAQIKEETKATIRCIPLVRESETGVDMISGKQSEGRVVFGRAF